MKSNRLISVALCAVFACSLAVAQRGGHGGGGDFHSGGGFGGSGSRGFSGAGGFSDGTNTNWDAGTPYDYDSSQSPSTYRDHELNDAVGQIRNVFDSQSTDAIDYLVPESGKVAIYNDGKYTYSLSGHQFRAMIDNIHGTQTEDFRITDVREDGDTAIVRARHTIADPEGGSDTIYQSYRLRREGEHYEVTDFSTSKDEHIDPF